MVNIIANEYEEISITFDYEQLIAHVPGFCRKSEWLQYGCYEDAFNSIQNLLDDSITGCSYNRQKDNLKYLSLCCKYRNLSLSFIATSLKYSS